MCWRWSEHAHSIRSVCFGHLNQSKYNSKAIQFIIKTHRTSVWKMQFCKCNSLFAQMKIHCGFSNVLCFTYAIFVLHFSLFLYSCLQSTNMLNQLHVYFLHVLIHCTHILTMHLVHSGKELSNLIRVPRRKYCDDWFKQTFRMSKNAQSMAQSLAFLSLCV